MNIAAMKTALMSSKPNCIYTRASLFHATPFLERRRRHHWEFFRRRQEQRFVEILRGKQLEILMSGEYMTLDRAKTSDSNWGSCVKANIVCREITIIPKDTEGFAQNKTSCAMPVLMQISSSRIHGGSMKMTKMILLQVEAPHGLEIVSQPMTLEGPGLAIGDRGAGAEVRGFRFCDDDDNDTSAEAFFRSIFGGNRFYYWSFVDGENPQWSNSSTYSGRSWNWRHRFEEECEYESECSQPDLASDRLALGLSAYGPLKLEDVKNAYRTCALNWHPDRHQGSSKVVAEEKFKLCSAAYQSLCDKLGFSFENLEEQCSASLTFRGGALCININNKPAVVCSMQFCIDWTSG
ncbi:hypothetical protein L484_028019 [Morus notabilis]|uniref:J domain-containing protein n=1 Tax=Morus notabilis TaxID=981085 RepID=W9S7R0_9ROSA|nr:hypothetical protein L484_028019 [Morus notabilis]